MSSEGNRSQPNSVRVGGKPDGGPKNPNRSDITDRMQAGSTSPGKASTNSGDTHQESRDHNKHNNPGQGGHKPQDHDPAEEKR